MGGRKKGRRAATGHHRRHIIHTGRSNNTKRYHRLWLPVSKQNKYEVLLTHCEVQKMSVVVHLLLLIGLFISFELTNCGGAHTYNLPLGEISSLNTTNDKMVTCFRDLLRETQKCDNQKRLYYARQGGGEFFGFGSEFNYHLTGALTLAIARGQRLVIVRDQSELIGYQCPHSHFWYTYSNAQTPIECPHIMIKLTNALRDCYLAFPCEVHIFLPHLFTCALNISRTNIVSSKPCKNFKLSLT